MKNLKIFIPIIIAIIIILVDYNERMVAGAGLKAFDTLMIYITYIILACLVSYLLSNQIFFKFIALGGFVIKLLLSGILIINEINSPHIKLDMSIPAMGIFLEAIRIIAIYCLISHKHIPRSTSSTQELNKEG
jgi:hypothetical protein